MSASVAQFCLLFRFLSMGSRRVSSSVRVSTSSVLPTPVVGGQRVLFGGYLAPGSPGLSSPLCLSLRSPAGRERGCPQGVPTLSLDRTSTADSTGPGARPQGETGHGPPTAFGGSTLGKQEQPPSTLYTEKKGPATDPPPVPGPSWAWTSTCDLPELMPVSQGARGAPTMSLGKLSPVGWVSSSHGKRRLTADMISPPLGDFRHTMHVGRGGDVFGDTSFLSNHGGGSGGTHRSPRSFLAKKLQQVRRVGALPRRIASPPSASPAPPAVSPIIKNAISLPQLNQAAYDSLDSLMVGKLSFNSSPAGSADGHSSYGERLGDLPVFPSLRPRGLNGSTKPPSELFSP